MVKKIWVLLQMNTDCGSEDYKGYPCFGTFWDEKPTLEALISFLSIVFEETKTKVDYAFYEALHTEGRAMGNCYGWRLFEHVEGERFKYT